MEQVIIKTFYNLSAVFTVLAYFQKEKVIYRSKTGNNTKEVQESLFHFIEVKGCLTRY